MPLAARLQKRARGDEPLVCDVDAEDEDERQAGKRRAATKRPARKKKTIEKKTIDDSDEENKAVPTAPAASADFGDSEIGGWASKALTATCLLYTSPSPRDS